MSRIFILLLPIIMFGQIIRFAPLPIDTENNLYKKYQPLLNYLSKATNDKYKFVYYNNYKKLLNNFKAGKVDMIILGALPYLRLKSEFKDVKPIGTFLNKNNQPYYTCQIITSDEHINSLNDIDINTKIFLTNKLSTCGYLMTQYMFKKANKNLDDYNYKYVGNHINVVFYTTLYNNAIGDVKSSIANTYKHFIKVIDTSIHIPGFSIVVNTKNVRMSQINSISKALDNYPGIIATPKNFYEPIEKIKNSIKVK